jgi:Periplasmic copper-binding protein (NosD)
MIGRHRPIWQERIAELVRHAIGLMLIMATAVVLPAPAFSQPPISITACGKITKAGLYELDNDLVASSPSAGDCLVVTAANVALNLNHFGLFGATSAVGIHVMKTAAKAFIEGDGSTIETFGVGIQIDAPGALADNFTVLSNTDAGVLLNHAQQADLSNFFAVDNKNDGVRIDGGGYNVLQMPVISGNGRYGVWAQSSSHNSVGNFAVQNNSLAGIYIGCSTAGPRGLCSRGAMTSNYNYLFSGIAGIFASGVQQYGVAIDQGDNFNRVVNVVALQNNQLDLFDVNADCASNYWFAEAKFGQVAPQNCIN